MRTGEFVQEHSCSMERGKQLADLNSNVDPHWHERLAALAPNPHSVTVVQAETLGVSGSHVERVGLPRPRTQLGFFWPRPGKANRSPTCQYQEPPCFAPRSVRNLGEKLSHAPIISLELRCDGWRCKLNQSNAPDRIPACAAIVPARSESSGDKVERFCNGNLRCLTCWIPPP